MKTQTSFEERIKRIESRSGKGRKAQIVTPGPADTSQRAWMDDEKPRRRGRGLGLVLMLGIIGGAAFFLSPEVKQYLPEDSAVAQFIDTQISERPFLVAMLAGGEGADGFDTISATSDAAGPANPSVNEALKSRHFKGAAAD